MRRILKLLPGPIIGIIAGVLMYFSMKDVNMGLMAGIAVWMAVWWIFEPVNLYFTGLLPVFLFPLLGIMEMKAVTPLYMSQIIFLFIGGFFLAFALEKWDLHRRIALRIILSVGHRPAGILLGFMLASYLLSMWILNTATVMMLLPAVLAVVNQFEDMHPGGGKKLAVPVLLGVAYASSIGGTATLIGTAPNLIFMEFFNSSFPDYPPITFAGWMLFGLPLSLVFFVVCFAIIYLIHFRKTEKMKIDMAFCEEEYRKLGTMGYEELMLGIIFSITIFLWLFRVDIQLGALTIPGWTRLLPNPDFVQESTIAMLMSGILFLIPSKKKEADFLLNWKDVKKLPIGIIFLFGGGFALAKGIAVTGLSDWIAANLSGISRLPVFLVVLSLGFFMTFFTELTSNTASTLLILPVMLSVVQNVDYHPLFLLLPITFSASYAFMLPVATPPNTIVFGSEMLKVRDMARTGFWLNIAGVLLITLFVFTLGRKVFGI